MGSGPNSTRQRILDAAESLFAEKGASGTSLRSITSRAGVNLAGVHYHFGSKDALLDAVLERLSRPMNEERLTDLARLESSGTQPAIEEILRAFLVPGSRNVEALTERRDPLAKLRARLEAEPPEMVEAIFRRHFGGVCAAFVEALQRALPELSKELVADRFRLALGALSFAFSGNFDLDTIPGHPPSATQLEAKVARAIDFLAAGLRAPSPPSQAPCADPESGPCESGAGEALA